MKLIIIAGGKGTRLGRSDIPKPMVRINGIPILEYQILLAKKYGLTKIYILSGYKSECIIDYFNDGKKWGVEIIHFVEDKPLGTAGSIKSIQDILTQRFMVFYGDTIMDINLQKMIEFDKQNNSMATLLVHPNDHPYDSDIVNINEFNNIIELIPKSDKRLIKPNMVNAALYILSPEILNFINKDELCDFGINVFPKILANHKIIKAYHSAEYIKDMGTPDRLLKISSDVKNGKVERLNNQNKRKAIFLDRDGVINKEISNLNKIENFELLDSVSEAILKINKSDFLAIVVTNQPIIAKGLCSFNELKEIHNKLETLLGLQHAYLDKIYFCPHHPEKGFNNEIVDLKIKCICRKPNIGMITQAINDFNIDISGSFIIGDRTVDIQTGINANLNTILVNTGYAGSDNIYSVKPDFISNNLLEAVNVILNLENNLEIQSAILKIKELVKSNKKLLKISICGLSRSGKSTLIKYFQQALLPSNIESIVIHLDYWILPYSKRKPSMDVRDRYQYPKITSDLSFLFKNNTVKLKPYESSTREISNEEISITLNDTKLIFIDGVISIDHPYVFSESDLKIFVKTDEEIRKNKFFEFYKSKNLSENEIVDLYYKRIYDENEIITNSKSKADLIINL